MAGLKFRNVRKSFDRVEILHGIDLDISDGEFVVIVGPSGCGKSTVLRLIAGLEEITSGDLWIGDKRVNDLPPARRGISMVFQSYALYPHMTVFENMAFGMKLARSRRDEIEERVRGAAAMLELSSLLERRPRELSGGQRQRVAIGRAIVRDPKVFLFDEPLSNLDASLRTQMRAEIARLQDHLGVTTVYVTHDQVEAMTLADRIVVLRDGVVEQVGAPLDLYHRPATQFVAGFIGSPQMNFVEVELTEIAGGHGTLTLRGGGQVELPLELGATKCAEPRVLGIRPEHLTLSDESGLVAAVELVEELGEAHHLHVVLRNGERLIVKGNGPAAAKAGDRIMLGMDAASAHLFDEGGTALPQPSCSSSTMVLG